MKVLCPFTSIAALAALLIDSAFAQGSLTPPSAPAPLFKTLQQIEPRTPISSLPTNITAAGSYYLTTNLTGIASTNGITITADNVTLDLMGFTLTGVVGSEDGISVMGQHKNIAVRNGVARNWGQIGINLATGNNGLLEGLRASDNGVHGISAGPKSVVTSCVSLTNQSDGMQVAIGSVVRDCIASHNNHNGIVASQNTLITQCTAFQNRFHGIIGVGGCYLLNNIAAENGSATTNAAGIFVTGTGGARVDGNVLVNNTNIGIRVVGSDTLVVRNSARGQGTNYFVSGSNAYGPTNDVSGVITDTNPWRNFSF